MSEAPVNPAPPEATLAVYVFREALACVYLIVWLLLFAGELLTGRYVLPFWFHCTAVGVLAYALGVTVASLTSFRDPSGPGGRGGHVTQHPPEG